MPFARDEAGNVYEVDAQGNPIRLVQPASTAGGGNIIEDPYAAQERQLKAQQAEIERARLGIAQQGEARQGATLNADVRKAEADATTAEIKAQQAATEVAKAPKPEMARIQQSLRTSSLIEALNTARQQIGKGRNTGNFFGSSTFSGIPFVGQNSTNLKATLDGLKGSILTDTLATMKAQSATGASGMGSLTEKEGERLAASIAALQQEQDADSLRRNLAKAERHYRNMLALSYGEDPREPEVMERYGIVPDAPAGGDNLRRAVDAEGRDEYDPGLAGVNSAVTRMIQDGADETRVRNYLNTIAPGMGDRANNVAESIEAYRQNPAIAPRVDVESTWVPTTGVASAIGEIGMSPVGSGIVGAADVISGGVLDNLTANPEAARAIMSGLQERNPTSYLLGQIGGGIAGSVGLTGGFTRAGLGGLNAARAGDVALGAAYGAGSADDEDQSRVLNALLGGAVGGAGGAVGRKVADVGGRAVNSALGRPNGPTRSEDAILNALGGTQEEAITRLQQASQLGVPMSLADVSRPVNNLTGAAMRRNPEAAQPAVNSLMQRSNGQYDRLLGAVERDLGPIGNIPQMSDDLIKQAREAAGPLYEQAYQNPVVSTPVLEDLLSRPFGRQALGRAKTIAANEGRDPMAMGFALDDAGDVVLNPVPQDILSRIGAAETAAMRAADDLKRAETAMLTGGNTGKTVPQAQAEFEAAQAALAAAKGELDAAPTTGMASTMPGYTTQTLDYTKRGMDDVLEQYRNPLSGKLVLDEAGRAQNQVLRDFLGEVDRLNPTYGQARSVYAGPASEKEAMIFGQSALRYSPDELSLAVQGMTPQKLGQVQLGSRDDIVERAGGLRNNSNPFSILNTPNMEKKLGALYPGNDDGIARLLLQRDLEAQAAGSANRLVGNSATADRLAADQAFAGNGLAQSIFEGVAETAITGAPVVSALRSGLGKKVSDLATFGVGKRAEKMAEEIIPATTNMNADEVIASILAATTKKEAEAIARRFRQSLGGPVGTPLAILGANRE